MKLNLSQRFRKSKAQLWNLVKIRLVGIEFFRADRRTDRHVEADSSLSRFYWTAQKLTDTLNRMNPLHIIPFDLLFFFLRSKLLSLLSVTFLLLKVLKYDRFGLTVHTLHLQVWCLVLFKYSILELRVKEVLHFVNVMWSISSAVYWLYSTYPTNRTISGSSSGGGRVIFCNMVNFLRRGVVSTSPNSQAGGPPLVGCPRMLIQNIRSYPPYLEVVSPSATWWRAMPWWQGPTYHGVVVVVVVSDNFLFFIYCEIYRIVYCMLHFICISFKSVLLAIYTFNNYLV
jgi:hypothetical protein